MITVNNASKQCRCEAQRHGVYFMGAAARRDRWQQRAKARTRSCAENVRARLAAVVSDHRKQRSGRRAGQMAGMHQPLPLHTTADSGGQVMRADSNGMRRQRHRKHDTPQIARTYAPATAVGTTLSCRGAQRPRYLWTPTQRADSQRRVPPKRASPSDCYDQNINKQKSTLRECRVR